MQTMTININEKFTLDQLDTGFSLKPFIDFLKKSVKNDNSLKDKMTGFILDKLAQYPELEGDIPWKISISTATFWNCCLLVCRM